MQAKDIEMMQVRQLIEFLRKQDIELASVKSTGKTPNRPLRRDLVNAAVNSLNKTRNFENDRGIKSECLSFVTTQSSTANDDPVSKVLDFQSSPRDMNELADEKNAKSTSVTSLTPPGENHGSDNKENKAVRPNVSGERNMKSSFQGHHMSNELNPINSKVKHMDNAGSQVFERCEPKLSGGNNTKTVCQEDLSMKRRSYGKPRFKVSHVKGSLPGLFGLRTRLTAESLITGQDFIFIRGGQGYEKYLFVVALAYIVLIVYLCYRKTNQLSLV